MMSLSASSSTRQAHTVLGGGGIRYETAELILSTIPNFNLKQKGRILQLFEEALDERQNHLDSLLADRQADIPSAEPFAFESEIDSNTYPVTIPSKPDESESNTSNETIPQLTLLSEKENQRRHCGQGKSNWTSAKDLSNIKKEPITPVKTKRRQSKTPTHSKQNGSVSTTPLRQMTMTQLFAPLQSTDSTPIKQEPGTPVDDTVLFMPESLIGLAQPSDFLSDYELDDTASIRQSLKRKAIPSPLLNETFPDRTSMIDEEENIQNDAILQSPYAGIESEELLYACPMCRNYWLGLPEELRHREGLTCRHRQKPVARTPEHFWSLGIPSTQTCIERGYGGVLPPDKPIERPRRPRRQYQRQLIEQPLQDNIQLDEDDD